MTSSASQPWKNRLPEIVLIFAVFAVQGAWPVPDVNEPYYLGKAIHYWNSNWVDNDPFLQSADAHWTFYVSFGWLSRWLAPVALAWTGRVLGWGLLAWAWQRLSWAVVPRNWFAVLSGGLFACLVERMHMSGEWVIGGVESKVFAYAMVFLALEALARDRWNRALLLVGGASFFHVLVGGWAGVAMGLGWLWLGRQRPPLRTMWPGLIGGLLLALPSLYGALRLDWGADAQTASRAHEIYVCFRLPHHLILQGFKPTLILRFAALITIWGLLSRAIDASEPALRLRAFVVGALGIALLGAVFSLLNIVDPRAYSGVLRFYWFRLCDVTVPLGVALLSALWIKRLLRDRPRWGAIALAVAVGIATLNVGAFARQRYTPTIPRADRKTNQLGGYANWLDICRWVAASSEIPADARFLTPIDSQTFRWRTQRAEVVTRKDIPQDAVSVVKWWDALREIHGFEGPDPTKRYWIGSLSELDADRLRELAAKYHFDYVLTEAPGTRLPETPVRPELRAPRIALPVVKEMPGFIIYRIDSQDSGGR